MAGMLAGSRSEKEGKTEKIPERKVYVPQVQIIFLQFCKLQQIRVIAMKDWLSFYCYVIEQLHHRWNLQDA